MSVRETAVLLLDACRSAGVDPELIFEHYDEADLIAYRAALRDGSIRAADLPAWMASTERTILEGRCLCGKCKAVKA